LKKLKFTDEQALFARKQAEARQPIDDVCRQMIATEATFYVSTTRYGDPRITRSSLMRQLRDENARFEEAGDGFDARIVMPSETSLENYLAVDRRRNIAKWIKDRFSLRMHET
jgi:putative transposase